MILNVSVGRFYKSKTVRKCGKIVDKTFQKHFVLLKFIVYVNNVSSTRNDTC